MRAVHVGGSDNTAARCTVCRRSSRVVRARSGVVTLSLCVRRGRKAAVHKADKWTYTMDWMESVAVAQCTAAGVGRGRTVVQGRLEDWCDVEDGG